jgi:hypothetical protein
MNWFGNWSIALSYLATFIFGCWYGARWVHRHNVVVSRSSHRDTLYDLDEKTKELFRLLTESPCGVMATEEEGGSEEIAVEECAEGEAAVDSDIRVILY